VVVIGGNLATMLKHGANLMVTIYGWWYVYEDSTTIYRGVLNAPTTHPQPALSRLLKPSQTKNRKK